MQQLLLPKKEMKYLPRASHGGELRRKRKTKRPLVPGAITHIILKSKRAAGALSFRKHERVVSALLSDRSRKFHIEILDFVIMGNHIHLKAKFKCATNFRNFLRTFTGLLARRLTKARRGAAFGKFWDGLAYTRVLFTKLEEWGLRVYFSANKIEREIGYAERKRFLDKWNQSLYRFKTSRAPS